MTSAMADSSSITMMSPRAAPSELMSARLVACRRRGSKKMHETRSDSTFSPYQSGTRRVRIPSGLPGVALTAARQACALLGVDTVTEPGGQPRERHGQQEVTTMGHLHPCLLYTSPSPRDGLLSRMPSSA